MTSKVRPPTLSIMIPNFNHARFLPELLGSILSQSYRPLEVVVLDDCSSDESVSVVREWMRKDPLIRLVRNEQNQGVTNNVNRLVDIARGDFVYLSAADDFILPGFLDQCMSLLAQHPQAGLCSTLTRVIDEQGQGQGVLATLRISDQPTYFPPERVRKTLISLGSWIQGNTTIYRREAVLEAGGYRAELHSFTDAFLGQVVALRYGACFIPEPLAVFRRMPHSYAHIARADPAVERAMVGAAMRLMNGEYRELFPSGYAKLWKDEVGFDRARFAYTLLREDQMKFLKHLTEVVPSNGIRARIAQGIASLAVRAAGQFVTFSLLLIFFPHRVLRRQIWRAFNPKRRRSHSKLLRSEG